MEIIFSGRRLRRERASGGKVETCQRREGRDVPAAGRSRRASGRKVETCQRPEGRDVPAAGRSRRASGRKVETCQRPEGRDVPAAGRSRRASGRKVETCQRPEGRDVPAAGKVETCQRPGRSRRASGRAPAAGRSRRASGGHQRPEGRDVPAAGTSGRKVETCQRRAPAAGRSRRASGGHQRREIAPGNVLAPGTCQRKKTAGITGRFATIGRTGKSGILQFFVPPDTDVKIARFATIVITPPAVAIVIIGVFVALSQSLRPRISSTVVSLSQSPYSARMR